MDKLSGKYPPMYNAERYRKRYDAFTPQQMQSAWASSGQLPPVDPETIYKPDPVVQPAQPQLQAAAQNPYPAMTPEYRRFREMEAMGDTQGMQALLQQMPPQPIGLFGV